MEFRISKIGGCTNNWEFIPEIDGSRRDAEIYIISDENKFNYIIDAAEDDIPNETVYHFNSRYLVITLMETIIDIFINNNDLNSRNNHHYKIGNNQSPNNDERMHLQTKTCSFLELVKLKPDPNFKVNFLLSNCHFSNPTITVATWNNNDYDYSTISIVRRMCMTFIIKNNSTLVNSTTNLTDDIENEKYISEFMKIYLNGRIIIIEGKTYCRDKDKLSHEREILNEEIKDNDKDKNAQIKVYYKRYGNMKIFQLPP
ncbi:hypothetical protein H8356DRAFT_1347370 [Neocallimastix lanati (nom. inval.)]|nr:hypothetical protein H8356DRAFT_1347370 [Neocallimastix sp. JGI-2020a]